jgi:hypothetical protein
MFNHFMCPTCLLEYEDRRGYFSSVIRRNNVKNMIVAKDDDNKKQYCCNCGALSYVAVYFDQIGDHPCDGVHEPVDEDDLT